MPGVLTVNSTVICGHVGTVSVSGSSKLKVAGGQVLLKDGIAGKSVSGCVTPTVANPTSKPCTLVTSVNTGEATKLTVEGKGVMLDTLAGQTDGVVSGTTQAFLSATAVQTKLTAI